MEALARLNTVLAGRYRIERELVGGGMARVYVADELSLGRQVVIKVLRPELAEGLSAERFAREIRLAARLQHPNVVPVLAAGDIEGLPYYTMPFVRGHSLRIRLESGRIDLKTCARLLGDVARALAYAHGERVVHRDIKPENVLLSGDAAVVADFGIAKAIDASRTGGAGLTLTSLGSAVGTPAYMAPEQAAADPHLDHRVDLYAWGVMAYECLTGSHPFADRRTGHEMIKAHLIEAPPSMSERAPELPVALVELVMQCLAKDPVRRPARAEWLVEILDNALGTVSGVQSAASITAASHTGRSSSGTQVTYSPDAKPPAIAVLPFANMSADPEAEFFSDGMAEEILNALTKLSGLRVVSRTSSFAFKGKNIDIRDIGQQLGVGFVLEGSVRKGGSKLRITAQLIDAVTGHHLWSERYDRDMSDVFAVQDEITTAIRDALSERLLGIGPVEKQAAPAIDAETYELYLRGRHLIRRRSQGMIEGLSLMKQVITRAPEYAPAYAELGFAESMLIWYSAQVPEVGWPKVRAAAERAIELDPSYGRAHHVLGGVALWYEWDWAKAKALFDEGIAIEPDDAESYSHLLWWALAAGSDAEAVAAGERCAAMDPLNPSVVVNLAHANFLCRRYEATIATCDKILQLVPDYAEALRIKGRALGLLGRREEALQTIEQAVRLTGRHVWPLCDLFMINVAVGRTEEFRAIREELHRRAEREVILPLAFAYVDAWDPEPNADAYFGWMEKALAGRNFWMIMLHREPGADAFRGDPRFDDMLRRIGLTKREHPQFSS